MVNLTSHQPLAFHPSFHSQHPKETHQHLFFPPPLLSAPQSALDHLCHRVCISISPSPPSLRLIFLFRFKDGHVLRFLHCCIPIHPYVFLRVSASHISPSLIHLTLFHLFLTPHFFLLFFTSLHLNRTFASFLSSACQLCRPAQTLPSFSSLFFFLSAAPLSCSSVKPSPLPLPPTHRLLPFLPLPPSLSLPASVAASQTLR